MGASQERGGPDSWQIGERCYIYGWILFPSQVIGLRELTAWLQHFLCGSFWQAFTRISQFARPNHMMFNYDLSTQLNNLNRKGGVRRIITENKGCSVLLTDKQVKKIDKRHQTTYGAAQTEVGSICLFPLNESLRWEVLLWITLSPNRWQSFNLRRSHTWTNSSWHKVFTWEKRTGRL